MFCLQGVGDWVSSSAGQNHGFFLGRVDTKYSAYSRASLTWRSSGTRQKRRAPQLCVRTSEEKEAGGWFSVVSISASLQAQE